MVNAARYTLWQNTASLMNTLSPTVKFFLFFQFFMCLRNTMSYPVQMIVSACNNDLFILVRVSAP